MANPLRGEVELKAGERTYILRYTTNALVRLEEEFGKSVIQMAENASIKEARALVWAGLLHSHPNLTMEQAGDIMDEAGFTEAIQAASQALRKAFGRAAEGKPLQTAGENSPTS
ncbi:MAG TPA: GTA-gp10 family protein [Thermaerobacter sp.]